MSSEYAFAISIRATNSSNRSTRLGSSRFCRASGESSVGKSMTKVGWTSVGSTKASNTSFHIW